MLNKKMLVAVTVIMMNINQLKAVTPTTTPKTVSHAPQQNTVMSPAEQAQIKAAQAVQSLFSHIFNTVFYLSTRSKVSLQSPQLLQSTEKRLIPAINKVLSADQQNILKSYQGAIASAISNAVIASAKAINIQVDEKGVLNLTTNLVSAIYGNTK